MAIVSGRENLTESVVYNGREWKNLTSKNTHISTGSMSPALMTKSGRRPVLKKERR